MKMCKEGDIKRGIDTTKENEVEEK